MDNKRDWNIHKSPAASLSILSTIILTLILGSLSFFSGCIDGGRPPELSICNPSAFSDDSGGFIVAYQINSDDGRTTYLQRLDQSGGALWGDRGIELYSEQGNFLGSGLIASAYLVSDEDGNFIAVWPSENTLWAQKFNLEGNPFWHGGNVRLSDSGIYSPLQAFKAVSDPFGGVIIGWIGTDDNLYLQKINSEGNRIFDGKTAISDVQQFDLACNESGDTVIIWGDNKDSISIQRFNASGQQSWTTNLLISDMYGPGDIGSEFGNRIIFIDTNNVVVIWLSKVLSEDKNHIIGYHLYAQKIDPKGEVLWGNGILLSNSARVPQLVEDGSGGVLVLWEDADIIWAQRLGADGSLIWSESGVRSGQGEKPNFSAIYDGSGGTVIVWDLIENGSSKLYSQRIDNSGLKLWDNDGILVSKTSPYWSSYSIPAIISQDSTGGFIITWAAGMNLKGATSSYIQRISVKGELIWGDSGIRLDIRH